MMMKKPSARCRLLETASKLFFRKGYTEVGIDEIIEQSETAKATFYRHFPSKELLVEAWLMAIHEGAEDRQKLILESEGCPVGKIADSFDALMDYMTRHDFRGCPYSNSCAVTGPGKELIRKQIEVHKESSRRFYRQLCSLFVGDENGSAILGDRIFLLYSGATTEAQNLRDTWPVRVAKEAVLELCDLAAGGKSCDCHQYN
ncbi:MAG: TetR/AcrR family transcriptional regulator [Verrucomicrobiales bacterium]|nr:TetR/AcrR family transcriptional regulator [Verrucomicrobiales bacterium]